MTGLGWQGREQKQILRGNDRKNGKSKSNGDGDEKRTPGRLARAFKLVQGKVGLAELLDGVAQLLGGGGGVLGGVDGGAGYGDGGSCGFDTGDAVGVDAAGDGEGHAGVAACGEEGVDGVAGLGLLIETGVELDPGDAEGLELLEAGGLVGDTDHVGDDGLVVGLAGLDGAGDGAVAGGGEDGHDVGTGLEGEVGFELTGVHGLHVGEDELVGVGGLDVGDDAEALLLDEGGAELDDVDVVGDLVEQGEGVGGGEKVDGDLQFHDGSVRWS